MCFAKLPVCPCCGHRGRPPYNRPELNTVFWTLCDRQGQPGHIPVEKRVAGEVGVDDFALGICEGCPKYKVLLADQEKEARKAEAARVKQEERAKKLAAAAAAAAKVAAAAAAAALAGG
jgi:hypothetical protein